MSDNWILVNKPFLPSKEDYFEILSGIWDRNYLTNNGIKIINIGFPPKTFNINNENYIEINDNLTQNELISLFYYLNF
jgi:hypothetical protein